MKFTPLKTHYTINDVELVLLVDALFGLVSADWSSITHTWDNITVNWDSL